MSNEKHVGTGRYCGECMALSAPDEQADTYCRKSPGKGYDLCWAMNDACEHIIPSLEAQRLEQARIANELRALQCTISMTVGGGLECVLAMNAELSALLRMLTSRIREPAK